MFSSDYGSALIIEEREYLRKHASHIQVCAFTRVDMYPSMRYRDSTLNFPNVAVRFTAEMIVWSLRILVSLSVVFFTTQTDTDKSFQH